MRAKPDPTMMTTAPWELYTRSESSTCGGASKRRVWAAIQALYAAAEPPTPRAPLDVLLWARIAADNHATRVIQQVKTYMGPTT